MVKLQYSDDNGLVAMSHQGSGPHFQRSMDGGESWVSESSPAGATFLSGLAYSPELSLFVAGSEGPNLVVLTSNVSGVWESHSAPSQAQEILWIPAPASHFVALCSNTCSPLQSAMTSPDGKIWQLRDTPVDLQWRGLAYSPSLQRVVATALDASMSSGVMTSDDFGITWTLRETPAGQWNSVVWADEIHRFAALSLNGDTTMHSTDGIVWVAESNPTRVSYSLDWSSQLQLMVAPIYSSVSGEHIATYSRDGAVWHKLRPNPVAPSWRLFTSIQFVGEPAGRFVAAGSETLPQAVMTYDALCFPMEG